MTPRTILAVVRTVLRAGCVAELARMAKFTACVPRMVAILPRALSTCVAFTGGVSATSEAVLAGRARSAYIARSLARQELKFTCGTVATMRRVCLSERSVAHATLRTELALRVPQRLLARQRCSSGDLVATVGTISALTTGAAATPFKRLTCTISAVATASFHRAAHFASALPFKLLIVARRTVSAFDGGL